MCCRCSTARARSCRTSTRQQIRCTALRVWPSPPKDTWPWQTRGTTALKSTATCSRNPIKDHPAKVLYTCNEFLCTTTKAPATATTLIRVKLKFEQGLTFIPSSLLRRFESIVNSSLNPKKRPKKKTRQHHQHMRVITITAL